VTAMLDPPGIGEVDVDIYYSKGAFWLHFTCEYESNEQEKALQDLIIEFGGKGAYFLHCCCPTQTV